VAFDPLSSRLALSGNDPVIDILYLDIRQPLAEVVHRIRASIEDVAFDERGTSISVTTLDDTRLQIDVASRAVKRLPDVIKADDVTAVAERPGVQVTGYKDGRIVVEHDHDSTTLAGVKLSWVMTLRFSLDGKILAAGDNSGVIATWETKSWTLRHSWKTTNTAGASLAFSGDGRRLAVADAGTPRITMIDLRRNEATAFDGNCHRAFSVAFARDGTTLVTGCDDGSLELLDVETRERLGTLPDLEDPREPDYVKALARHPLQERFAAGTEDGRIMIWTLDPAVWKRRACRRANRDLTEEIPGWSGEPLVPCSALLKNAPSDEHRPDAERDLNAAPRIPDNVASVGASRANHQSVRAQAASAPLTKTLTD
jgi:WD40 repeat protein